MSDLALIWDNHDGSADLALVDGALVTDDGLDTAIMISLFTDRRARADDILAGGEGSDPRGWWGDGFADAEGDDIGSHLWLLEREKRLPAVRDKARQYARDALAWLIADQVCASIDVIVETRGSDQLAIGVTAVRPTGPARLRFDYLWDQTGASRHAVF